VAQILYVEDDHTTREALGRALGAAGHKVVGVPNGKDAMVEVLQRPPDVILLDLHMPGMDGPSFLVALRTYLRAKSVPVVVLTGLSDGPMIDRAQALNVNSVLTKGNATGDDIQKAIDKAIIQHPG
jgi:CheY-like chemotaxis protein